MDSPTRHAGSASRLDLVLAYTRKDAMRRTRLCCGLGSLGALLLSAPVLGQVTTRVSVSSSGAQGNAASAPQSISGDGHFVAFASDATNLVLGDTNGVPDIFVHDCLTGITERVSLDSLGGQANGFSHSHSVSANGRHVVFESDATNLVAGDTNGWPDVFVHDRLTAQTTRISVGATGAQANHWSGGQGLSVSGDGRYVAFNSLASNLVASDSNSTTDIFVHDRDTDADGIFDEPGAIVTTIASLTSAGAQGNAISAWCAISSDGRQVAFVSFATNLVAGDTNGFPDVFVHDMYSGQTSRVSLSAAGVQGNALSGNGSTTISGDGRYVGFNSFATNLDPSATLGWQNVFVHDRDVDGDGLFDEPGAIATTLASADSAGVQGNGSSCCPSLSSDGRFLTFNSGAPNLVAGDTNGVGDVFVRDRQYATIERVSLSAAGAQGNGSSSSPSISDDGRLVAFLSEASNLVAGDANGYGDVFVRDRDCSLASASFRNSGSNPASFTCNAPVLGASWSGTVDLTTTGHSSAYLYAFAAQTTTTLSQGQVLLGSGQLARFGPVAGPLASFSLAVPISTSLCGLHLTTQALHLGTVQPFATSNAMDLVLGQ